MNKRQIEPRVAAAAVLVIGGIVGGIAGCGESPSVEIENPQESVGQAANVTQSIYNAKIIAKGASISGANGIHFGPDGLLYVASVIGSELLALDPANGEIKHR